MTSPDRLAPAPPAAPGLRLAEARVPSPELSRFLYTTVGGPWRWTDRLPWDLDDWRAHLASGRVRTHLACLDGTPAGYAELERDARENAIELNHLGLLPGFLGRGIGPRLLQHAIAAAWRERPERVHLTTCSLDGPAALSTYLRAGFEIYDEREYPVDDADPPREPQPGAPRGG